MYAAMNATMHTARHAAMHAAMHVQNDVLVTYLYIVLACRAHCSLASTLRRLTAISIHPVHQSQHSRRKASQIVKAHATAIPLSCLENSHLLARTSQPLLPLRQRQSLSESLILILQVL